MHGDQGTECNKIQKCRVTTDQGTECNKIQECRVTKVQNVTKYKNAG